MDDRARFEAVYDRYSGLIFTYAVRRGCPAEDATDVVADTFLTAWRRMDDLPAGEQARPWLYGVARRVLANHRRSGHRRLRLANRLSSEPQTLVDAAVADGPDRLDLAEIAAAFSKLRDADQELLRLIAWEGLQRDELAQVLGCSKATARVRLHRARRRFQRALDGIGVQRLTTSGHELYRRATARPGTEDAL